MKLHFMISNFITTLLVMYYSLLIEGPWPDINVSFMVLLSEMGLNRSSINEMKVWIAGPDNYLSELVPNINVPTQTGLPWPPYGKALPSSVAPQCSCFCPQHTLRVWCFYHYLLPVLLPTETQRAVFGDICLGDTTFVLPALYMTEST